MRFETSSGTGSASSLCAVGTVSMSLAESERWAGAEHFACFAAVFAAFGCNSFSTAICAADCLNC